MKAEHFQFTFLMCLCALLTGIISAEIVPDIPIDPNSQPMQPLAAGELIASLDNPNAAYLIYDAGDGSITDAMDNIGALNVRVRSNSQPVTAQDWEWCDIVVIGANSGSDSITGIDTEDIDSHIMGRVVLSGHDADLHASDYYSGDTQWAAQMFLIQSINYVMEGAGKGLIGFGDSSAAFDWAPDSWELETTKGFNEEEIVSITDEGLATGVYDDLTPALMSNWEISFHVRFDDYGLGFVPCEIGKFNSVNGVVTIAAPINPMGFDLQKYDDVVDGNCVNIDDGIEYTIEWHNMTDQTFYDAYLRDVFPAGVTYPVEYTFDPNTWEFISSDPGYDEETHTYIYPIGTLDPDDSGILQLGVIVNALAEPGYYLHNVAQLWATVYDPNGQNPVEQLIATAYEDTLACCWDTNGILYVDKNAVGSNTGVSWTNAYTDLQDALTRARETHCTFDYVIYCAQGVYTPGDDENDTFELTPNLSLYGGFPTHGCDFSLRNPKKYVTTLTGYIDEATRNDTVLSMGDNTLLDGFTITGASQEGYGIYGSGVDFSVVNSKIEKNWGFGSFIENGNATFQWCNFLNNDLDGIRHTGSGYTLTLENCWIRQSGQHAVFSTDSTPTIINSVLSESDMAMEGRAGLLMENPTNRPFLQNVTCAHNKTRGIWRTGGALPEIYNSIVYHNGAEALIGFSADDAAMYSCIEDANSINGNINVDPQFAYFDPNNVRLSPQSDCRHASAPSSYVDYSDQLDMDGNPRVSIVDTPPDMGAYEMICDTEVSNVWDWNADGLVNLYEFNYFSHAWLSRDPNDPTLPSDPNLIDPNEFINWDSRCDLNQNYRVDLADLMTFLEDAPWLWRACWLDLEDLQTQQMTSGGGENTLALSGVEEAVLSSAEGMAEAVIPAQRLVLAQAGTGIQLDSMAEPEALLVVEEKSVAEQVAELQDSIEFLGAIWTEDPVIQQEIDPNDWQQFMDSVSQSLLKLQTEAVQIE